MTLTISLGAVTLVLIALYVGYRIGNGSELRNMEREYAAYQRAVNYALVSQGQEPLK
jgi:hypothetical protein